jgi:hypothetical protein
VDTYRYETDQTPNDWWKQGRRRYAEASAHNGSDNVVDALRYWAAEDYDAEVIREDRGNVFMFETKGLK